MTATQDSRSENSQSRATQAANPALIHTAAARYRVGAIVALSIAFALRLIHLGQESLWYDEIVSVDLAAAPLPALIAQTARDIHPPGYYLLLHGWQQLSHPVMELGYSFEFLYTFPSVFFGLIVCALIYMLARHFFSPQVALLALSFAALHPFQIEYSQEVRMYTLGATLCLLYFYLSVKILPLSQNNTPPTWKTGLLLGAITAGGLYTFYYFGFLLAALGLLIGGWLVTKLRRASRHSLRAHLRPLFIWLIGHIFAVLLWLPWLPVFMRQAVDPPVPPWREPWRGLPETLAALVDTATVYLVGHAYHAAPWIGLTGLILFVFISMGVYAKSGPRFLSNANPIAILLLAVFALAPPFLIIGISTFFTPLFHPRYLYVYHAPFLILLAAGVMALMMRVRTRRPLFIQAAASALLIIFPALFVGGTIHLWNDPAYHTDDHRRAIAHLAREWRPGEVILVNAGWVYRAFNVYWPVVPTHAEHALPPPLAPRLRLVPPLQLDNPSGPRMDTVPLLYSGSVDGVESLGWQHPQADFFSVSAPATLDALEQIATQATAIWHYRLYDTVNDPDQTIRAWLADRATLITSDPIPGRDFLRLEYFELPGPSFWELAGPDFNSADSNSAGAPAAGENVSPARQTATQTAVGFQHESAGQLLELTTYHLPLDIEAGAMLYVPLRLAYAPVDAGSASLARLGISLRLLDDTGIVHAQHDLSMPLPAEFRAAQSSAGQNVLAPIPALAIPAALPPGSYRLQLIIYDPETLAPLTPHPPTGPRALTVTPEHGAELGEIQVHRPSTSPTFIDLATPSIARFDYIRLLSAQWSATLPVHAPAWELNFVWLPQAAAYRDNYDMLLEWHHASTQSDSDSPVAAWRAPIGPAQYPSGDWQTGYPVRRSLRLDVPPELTFGSYALRLSIRRAHDDAIIPAHTGWGWRQSSWIELGEISLVD